MVAAWLWIRRLVWLVLLLTSDVHAQQTSLTLSSVPLAWELGPTGSRASLRGLSAPADDIVWACGTQGTVLRSLDGGSSWLDVGPVEFSELDFRALHAWDAQKCCIASAGFPAVILRTSDGGQHWQEAFRHPSQQAFLDGLKFWDAQRGLAFGDPLDGRILLLETDNAGVDWRPIESRLIPEAAGEEAGFAASNSSMAIAKGGRVWIGTGVTPATVSRIYFRPRFEAEWQIQQCPMPSGATTGIFSLAVSQRTAPNEAIHLVAVGGDYRQGAEGQSFDTSLLSDHACNACVSRNGGKSWRAASQPPKEFRSAVVQIPAGYRTRGVWIAVGPTGSDWSKDGMSWQTFTTEGFHTLVASPNRLFAAGANGRFAVLIEP